MGALMRAHDWSGTPLGAPETWPQSLRTSVSTCLNCAFPILLWWGPDLVMLYNDEYIPILGSKHPAALGQAGAVCWSEIWHVIGPMLQQVLRLGEPTRSRDLLLTPQRNGYPEECYFSFSYSPIRDESGGIGGVFTPVIETTAQVIGERRLRTLRDLASHATSTLDVAATAQRSADVLGQNPHDIPFAAIYLAEPGHRSAALVAHTGVADPALPFPTELKLDDAASPPWPEQPDKRPIRTLQLPVTLAGQDQPSALLVAGLSPRLALDQAYREFLELAAGQVGNALADAMAYETEHRRAEALAQLDQAKTAFFANVSHEFRTPLTLLLGPLEDQLADPSLPPAVRERTELAHRNALRLLRLVNDLLDFSRTEAGRAKARLRLIDLAVVTADLASGFRSLCERAGLSLEVDCPPLPAPVPVDPDMWEKIVLNLLSNAFKFTRSGGIRVALRPAADPAFVELTVADSGIGIAPAAAAHLFDRFYRVAGAEGRTHEGAGIGLAMVRELARLHGGDVAVASEPGQGSTFTVRIARHAPGGFEDAAPRDSVTRHVAAALEEASRWVADSSPDSVPAEASGRPRILVADDNQDMRAYVRRLLERSYAVETAEDGEAALALATARPPDLVVADVMMPRLDGLALVGRVRADPATSLVPVILLSARAGSEAGVEGLQAGADDYVVKPFAEQELLARVAANLRAATARREALELEQKWRAEAEAANARFSFALAAARMVAWEWDLATGIVHRTQEARQLLGFESGPIEAFRSLIHPADRDRVEAAWQAARLGEDGRELEYRVNVEGKELWLTEKSRLTRNADGGLRLAGVVADVTARKQAEQALSQSEERLRQLAENIREVFYVSDPRARRVEYVSPAYEAIWGLPTADLYADQAAFFTALHPDDREAFRAVVATQVRVGEPTEQRYRIIRPDGSIRRIRDRAWPLRDAGGEVYRVVGLAEDETERLAAEERLAESEARLRQLNQTLEARVAERTAERDRTWRNAQDLLCIVDQDGRFRAANPAWTTVLGWLPEEVVGQHHLFFTHPDHQAASAAARAVSAQQPLPNYESRLRHKDGSYRWIAWVAAAEGDMVYASGRHITAEKEAAAALARTQDLLRQAQKMEALGQLTGGIAHDFNNMLQGVTSGINLARRRMEGGKPEEAGKFLDAAVDAAGRAGALVHRLLAFARRQALLPRRIDLNRLLGGMAELIRQTVGAPIIVTQHLAETVWPVLCDPSKFENTLLNLAINARDAMLPAGGSLLIETANVRLEAADLSGWDTAAPGDHVRLSVIDSGVGMPADVLEHAFEPFFTTKPVGQGTGLGLSQVFGFVSQSKGVVRLQSQVGRGTAVHIYLPRHIAPADAAPPTLPGARTAPHAAMAGTVLLVEDDATLRLIAAEALREAGCTIIEAKDGPTGLMAVHDAAATQPAGIDILVADVGLPGGLNGRQLADSARELMPTLPVLLITGYEAEALRAADSLGQGIEIMAKPFALEALTARVRIMLTQKPV